MKKFLVVLLVSILTLVGCGSNDTEKDPEKKSEDVSKQAESDKLVFGNTQEWYDWGIETMGKDFKKKKFNYEKEIESIVKDDADKETKAMAMTYMAKMYKASEDELNTFLNELIDLYEKDSYISDDEKTQLIMLFKSYAVERYTKSALDDAQKDGVNIQEHSVFYMNSFVTNMSNSIKYVYREVEKKGDESYNNYRNIMGKQLEKMTTAE